MVELLPEEKRRKANVKTRVKNTEAVTTVFDNGTGKYTVMGYGIEEFRQLQARFYSLIVFKIIVRNVIHRY